MSPAQDGSVHIQDILTSFLLSRRHGIHLNLCQWDSFITNKKIYTVKKLGWVALSNTAVLHRGLGIGYRVKPIVTIEEAAILTETALFS